MNISITISNKIATITSPTYAVCDNTDYTVVFTFDSEWTAYTTKTARFAYSGGHYDAVFTGNSVTMPKIENADMVLIGVFAGDLHTTTPAKLPMVRSILHSNGGVICPSDHVYDQVLEQLNHKVTEPTTDGTSGQVLTTDGNGGRSWTTCEGTTDHSQLDHLAYAESGHTGFQPTIDDLATIRSGAALGATALQSVPDTYRTSAAQDVIDATKASSSDLGKTDRSLEALWELSKGQVWDFDTDDETVYSKTIPSGSRYASVDSIGGRSVVANQISTFANKSGRTNNVPYFDYFANTEIHLVAGKSYYVRYNYTTDGGTPAGELGVGLLNSFKENLCTIVIDEDRGIGEKILSPTSTQLATYDVLCMRPVRYWSSKTYAYSVTNTKLIDLTAWFGAGNEPSTTTDPKMNEVYAYLEAHPEYNAGTIVHGAVTSVEVKDADAVVTKTEQIPAAVQALTGYGWSAGTAKNWVDYANKQYHQEVGVIDLGTKTWNYESTPMRFNFLFTDEKPVLPGVLSNIVCSKYTPYSRSALDNLSLDKVISSHAGGNDTWINIRDKSYTNPAAFKESLSGVLFYYELKTPIITDISSMLTDGFLTSMPCEADGSVTFKQSGTQLQVPVQNTYLVKLSEVEE